MKIVVIGGTGLIGSRLVAALKRLGHDAIPAAPNTGVNTLTGEGVAEVLGGAEVVVDLSNSPSFEDDAVMAFFKTSGRILLAAEEAAGVRHHIALSVVGADRLTASGYMRAKVVQEELIKASPVPYTILRSTQFFPFIAGIIESAAKDGEVHLSSALVQPIHADDVVAALAKIVLAGPLNKTVEIAGPETIRIDCFAEQYLSAKGDPRLVVADAKAPYFGAVLTDASLTPGADPLLGTVTVEDWLREAIPAD